MDDNEPNKLKIILYKFKKFSERDFFVLCVGPKLHIKKRHIELMNKIRFHQCLVEHAMAKIGRRQNPAD
jgi:hypothetical protein